MKQQFISSKLPAGYDPNKDQNYISADMCCYFKKKLEDMRQKILEKENSISLNLVNSTTQEPDPVDQGTTEDLHYGDLVFQEHEEHLRQEIESALQRIKDGTYGYCEITGKPIGVKRLLLVPTARYCIKVQEKIEKENKR